MSADQTSLSGFFADYQAFLKSRKPQTDKSFDVEVDHLTIMASGKETVGDNNEAKYPTLFNASLGKLKNLRNKREVVEHKILDDVSCTFKKKRMCLVFGSDQSGVSTLLKSISALTASNLKVTGDVLFNKTQLKKKYIRKIAAYVPEIDSHNGIMTVRETFEFSHKAQNGSVAKLMKMGHTKESAEQQLQSHNEVTKSIGLTECQDTNIGDGMYRGVSGGERRRVTLGEMLVGHQKVLCLDNITTGLDSAVSTDVIRMLRTWTDVTEGIVVASLLQPEPDVLELFDDVIMLDKGHVLYHGPIDSAVEYFEKAGFQKPEDLPAGDFLLDMSSPAGREVQLENIVTPTISEAIIQRDNFERRLNEIGRVGTAITIEEKEIKRGKDAKVELSGTPYSKEFGLSFASSLWLLFRRQLMLTFRDKGYVRGRMMQSLVMGFIMGNIFWQLDTTDYMSRVGLIFFGIMFLSMGAMAQIPVVAAQKQVFFKQRDAGFFHTTSYAVSGVLCQFIVSIVECLIMGTILYWCGGLANDWETFGRYILGIYLMAMAFTTLMRWIASVTPNESAAFGLASLFMVLFMTTNGYMLTKDNMNITLGWIYYINPFAYAINALVLNEFVLSGKYDNAYIGRAGMTEGEVYVDSYQMNTDSDYYYICMVILFAIVWIFTLFTTMSLHYLRPINAGAQKKSIKRKNDIEDVTITVTPSPTSSEIEIDVEKDSDGLPFQPVDFTFRNITYDIMVGKGKDKKPRRLLDGVSGYVSSGSMIALMGMSGAGKTTLIDVLASRKTKGTIGGEIRMNGRNYTKTQLDRVSGYVEQTDALAELDTVREILDFNARLRLPKSVSQEKRDSTVDNVIEMLGLEPFVDSLIGTKEDGLPLSIRKLVSVGVELVANPSIIFLDEPTTGLDASAAERVVKGLQKIAKNGRSIICTIHQPSPQVFGRFSELLLLQRGGQVVYFGTSNGIDKETSKLVQFLEGCDEMDIPHTPGMNVASWMLDVTGAGVSGSKIDFNKYYSESDLHKATQNRLKEIHDKSAFPAIKDEIMPGFFTQCAQLFPRYVKYHWRCPSYDLARFIGAVVVGVLIGIAFFQLDGEGLAGMQSTMGFIAMSGFFFGINTLNAGLPFNMSLRPSQYREVDTHAYGALPLSLMSLLAELPFLLFSTLCYAVIVYFMAGLEADVGKFAYYCLLISSLQTFLFCFANFLSSFGPTPQLSTILAGVFFANWNNMAGMVIPKPSIPGHWLWFHWISPLRYWLEGVLVDQFDCSGVDCPTVTVPSGSSMITITKSQWLQTFLGLDPDRKWLDVGVLIGAALFFRILVTYGYKKIRFMSR